MILIYTCVGMYIALLSSMQPNQSGTCIPYVSLHNHAIIYKMQLKRRLNVLNDSAIAQKWSGHCRCDIRISVCHILILFGCLVCSNAA